LAGGIVVYVYLGYPLVLTLMRGVMQLADRHDKFVINENTEMPTVSLLVPVYNERHVIEAKIRDSLALEYPPDRLEIIVASDGSDDGTAQVVRRFANNPRLRFFDYPPNRGKLFVLNDTIPHVTSEIVAFSDASSVLSPDAIRRLAAKFADPRVGGVSASYAVTKRNQALHGLQEDLYWQYESFLKRQEAAIGSILGCHGSLYAIRKDLYPYPDPLTINDDFVIPLRILRQGYRIVYEPSAVATEEAKEMSGFGRRIRIMTGNFRQIREVGALLHPVHPMELFFYLSHKGGRLIVPWALVVALIANACLLDKPFYRGIFALQLGFYALAAVGGLWPSCPRAIQFPFYFSMINIAAFLGLYYWLSPRNAVVWKEVRSPPIHPAGAQARAPQGGTDDP
jgi:glycosyltransferase involved in cell wall biosynthesis